MKPRIFIDSSVLFSAANSERGHSRDLLIMGVDQKITIVLSHYVLQETIRNLAQLKHPPLVEFGERLSKANPEFVEANNQSILEAGRLIVLKDAPIIAAAKAAKVDMLVTLDRKHILGRPELEAYIKAPILTPAEAFQRLKAENR
jgi:predicted nucleic acid-binding protein